MLKETQLQERTKPQKRAIIAIHSREEQEVLYRSISAKSKKDFLETVAEPTRIIRTGRVGLK